MRQPAGEAWGEPARSQSTQTPAPPNQISNDQSELTSADLGCKVAGVEVGDGGVRTERWRAVGLGLAIGYFRFQSVPICSLARVSQSSRKKGAPARHQRRKGREGGTEPRRVWPFLQGGTGEKLPSLLLVCVWS
eukprot:1035611-Rhodomonas_salina.4